MLGTGADDIAPARRSVLLGGRYQCGPVIARGASGEVRFGEDTRLDRPVAVKLLHVGSAASPRARRRFEQEAIMAARLEHPNVVRVFDCGETPEGVAYLVMECLAGATVADELSWGRTSEERARRLALDVLAALDAAHRRGIVHRDIKPANLLTSVASDGSLDGPTKVADFGIATTDDAEPIDLTEHSAVIGTPAYLSPERLEGKPATPASDLYSLGVVLYEALAGRKPFTADSRIALAIAIHEGSHTPLATLRPDVDPTFVAAIERALAPSPAARWASAAAMATAIQRPRLPQIDRIATPGTGPRLAPLVPDATQAMPLTTQVMPSPAVIGPAGIATSTPTSGVLPTGLRQRGRRRSVIGAVLAAAAAGLIWAVAASGDHREAPGGASQHPPAADGVSTTSSPAAAPVPSTSSIAPRTTTTPAPARSRGGGKKGKHGGGSD